MEKNDGALKTEALAVCAQRLSHGMGSIGQWLGNRTAGRGWRGNNRKRRLL